MSRSPESYRFLLPSELDVELLEGDILLVAGVSWLSRRIIWATRERGESPTRISHVDVVTTPGPVDLAHVHGAVGRGVREATIGLEYRDGQGLAVMRHRHLTEEQRRRIAWRAQERRGERYGWPDILLHLSHRLTRWEWPRRLVADRTPICSQYVGALMRAEGVSFGVVSPQPDDIDDQGLRLPGTWWWPLGRELRSLPPVD